MRNSQKWAIFIVAEYDSYFYFDYFGFNLEKLY